MMATSVPLQWQKQYPTRAAADAWLADGALDAIIVARRETNQAGDHEVAKARVKIVLAVVVPVMAVERAGIGMQSLS